MFGIILELIKPYYKYFAIAFIGFTVCWFGYNKIYNIGYEAGYIEYTKVSAELNFENQRLHNIVDNAKYESVIKYKDRIIYINKQATDIDGEIDNGTLREESANCHIGPNFIRLHNLSAKGDG